MKKIVILGGGVAGMSAAHELAERGFSVEVYERQVQYCGGKARSVNVPNTNLQKPDAYLPGEHGFRFFPGFYTHVTDTMKRIPYQDSAGNTNKHGCFDNLTATSTIMIARNNKKPIITVASFPRSLKDVELIIHDMTGGVDSGLSKEEIKFFAGKVWQLMTASPMRRENDYERLGWWYYMEADRFSTNYQHLLVEGLTRTLVAAQARSASTKTGGNIFLQLIYNMVDPTVNTDRVLNGPTNEKWLNPWINYLKHLGVQYHFGHTVTEIQMEQGRVKSATVICSKGEKELVTGDYFVLATPVEKAALLINEEMIQADATLGSVATLAKSVSWMNGVQFYLNEDVTINKGHIILSDSEWAITCISQVQFWTDYSLEHRFNGKVKGVLSVDVSDWLYTKYKGKLAEEYAPDEVVKMVWEQLKAGLNVEGVELLRDDMIEHYYLDRDIQWYGAAGHNIDQEPLLVNTTNSWTLRPTAETQIDNFFLAGDYVRTNTDLATMEGANESARRAVNGIIAHSKAAVSLCKVWPLKEPMFFDLLKWYDGIRYAKGLDYTIEIPWWLKICMIPWTLISIVEGLTKTLIKKITNH
ncbi:MAG TPA: phytoene dehydrogenase [Chitinophagaceae bacterium]|nr:phytoene dehydrogenase [Chitinophagaceae bacterium]